MAALVATPAQAQEPLWEELRQRITSEAFSFGALFQFVGDFQSKRSFPGESGFSTQNFRFNVRGRLDRGVDYILQSNFGRLLDARVGFSLHPFLTLDAGRFKAPYSGEFLTRAGEVDFVTRSQSVRALAPGRSLGVAARGRVRDGLAYQIGFFNGGGGVEGNERGQFRGVARVAWIDGGLEVAVNGALNGDRQMITDSRHPSFQTVRSLVGADVRYTSGPWLFSGEIDRADGQLETPADPWGGFLTAGYHIRTNSQVLLRLDHLETGVSADRRTLVLMGWNYWPTSATQVQLNGYLPVEGFGKEPRLLFNVELFF